MNRLEATGEVKETNPFHIAFQVSQVSQVVQATQVVQETHDLLFHF